MAGSIAKAYVQIVPSAEGIKGKLSNIFGSEMPSAGKSAGNSFASSLVGNIKTMIAAAGLGKMLTDAIMTGSDLQQLEGGVKKIFNEMDTSTIMADAANAYEDLNMSANQYLAVINDVGAAFAATMGDEKGYSVAKTGLQAISDYASGTGKNVDVLSQKFTMITRSTSSYQSIADQFSGILPATSAGFLEQAQAAGFLSGEYKKLTEVPIDEYQQAVSEMLKKGTAELGLAGNTAAETETTIAGSLAAMKSAFSNVLANLTLGRDLGPSLNALAETVKTFLVGNLAPAVINIISALPGAVAAFLNGIIPGNMLSIVTTAISQLSAFISANLPTILSDGARMITELGSGFIQGVPIFLSAVGELISSTLTAIITAGPSLLDGAFGLVDQLISGFTQNTPAFIESVGELLTKTYTVILDAAPSVNERGLGMVENLVAGFLNATPTFLSTVGNLLSQTLSAFLASLPSMMQSGVSFVTNLANGVINNLPAILGAAAKLIAQLLSTLASNLPQLLQKGIEMIANLAAGLIQAIPKAVAAIPQIISNVTSAFSGFDWGSVGSNIISGIAAGICNGVGAILSAAREAAQSALRAAKNALGIKSPSRVMRDEVGKFIPAGIAVGIEDNKKTLSAAMRDLSASTVDSFDADLSVHRTAPVGNAAGTSYGDFSFTFHVYTAPGQDNEQIARALMQEMQFEYERRLAQI